MRERTLVLNTSTSCQQFTVYRISPSDRVRLQSNFTLVSFEYLIDSLAVEADYERFELSDTLDPDL